MNIVSVTVDVNNATTMLTSSIRQAVIVMNTTANAIFKEEKIIKGPSVCWFRDGISISIHVTCCTSHIQTIIDVI